MQANWTKLPGPSWAFIGKENLEVVKMAKSKTHPWGNIVQFHEISSQIGCICIAWEPDTWVKAPAPKAGDHCES